MKKAFYNCDVLAVLQEIVNKYVEHYQTDFTKYDKRFLEEAANSSEYERKHIVWLARPCGTECFYERDIYVSETHPHHAWKYYHDETSDKIAAYAIELHGIESGIVRGDLYELDYAKHCESVKRDVLPNTTVIMYNKDGTQTQRPYYGHSETWWNLMHDENVASFEYQPEDLDKWKAILKYARAMRYMTQFKPCTIADLKTDYRQKNQAEM